MNVSILIGLVAACLGFSIALIVQTWTYLMYLRKAMSGEREPASLHLQ